ncbi:MAG: chloramphenicol acetyltransferase [Ignavibacteria bacterium]|nr:chloramphenicol acetyltransferase [Ignavibacteria bacterium]
MKKVKMKAWKRKPYYDFFTQFDEPFFGVVQEVECTHAYNDAKANKYSFFASYLHKAIIAANELEEFKYRVIDNEVVIYDIIHASPTIGRPDETFSFGYIPFNQDFNTFKNDLAIEIESIQSLSGIGLNENTMRNDLVHFSSVPWIKFTSVSHVRNFNSIDTIPKVTFGKAVLDGNKITMPISVHVHHGLMDALHVGKYLAIFQELLLAK